MNPFLLFREKAGESLSRKLFSSPHAYNLARHIFLKRANFPHEAARQLAALALEQAAAAYRGEHPVAWVSAFFPSEIVHAFKLTPFAPEAAAAVTASFGLSPRLLHAADRLGFSSDGCSFHRCAATGTTEEYFPAPDLLLASSHLCDGAPQLFRHLARLYRRPFYLLDVPVENSPAAERYLAGQLKELVRFLEKQTGRKLSAAALKETWENSNRAREARLQVNRLRQAVPSPMRGEDALAYIYLVLTGQGHPDTPAIYETLARELSAQKGAAAAGAGRERFRLLWLHLKPYHPNDLLSHLEKGLSARVAFEEFNDVFWPPLDPERPFVGLARKILSNPSLGPAQRRLKRIRELVEEYRIDGVVHFSHWGCRQSVGSTVYLKKQLARDGIPFLAIDGDCIDPNSFPPGQARTRIEGFVEMLADRG